MGFIDMKIGPCIKTEMEPLRYAIAPNVSLPVASAWNNPKNEYYYRFSFFFFFSKLFVFHAKLGTTIYHRTRSSDVSL